MRNPIYEQALSKQGVEFSYLEALPIDQIDVAAGLRNQARISEPIDGELVDAYAKADRDGDQFPPLVVWRRSPRAKHVLIDGNQRLQAKIKNKRTATDAYLVHSTDPVVVDRMTWTFNNLVNGKRLTQEECLEHAITFVRKYGYTHTDAALEWGVPLHRVSNRVKVLNIKDAIAKAGLPDRLDDERVLRLSPMVKAGEDVLTQGAKVAIDSGLTHEQITEMTTRVSRARTHADKVKVLEDYAKEEEVVARKAETKGGRADPKILPRQKLANQLATLVRLLEDFDDKALRPVGKEKHAEVRERALRAVERLTAVFGLGALPREEAS